ncbi:MAG TPA: hypothetical protein VKU02_05470 [Gemmataceae bacterium]|nr:hypothetical protein [Gemmataceae bacterium]
MRPNLLQRYGSRASAPRAHSRRSFLPFLELLESRLVPMGLTGPPPTLSSLSANTAQEGSGPLTITVMGANFVPGAVVDWNGIDLPTTFVSSTQLTATIPAALLAEESGVEHGGPAQITVVEFNTPSNAQQFVVTEAPIVAQGGFFFTGPNLTNVTVATFKDTGGPELPFPQDYTALVNWGDGVIDMGFISGPDQNGVFSVTGSHTYASNNPFTISVTITHETAPPVTVTDFVNGGGPVSAVGGFQVNGVEGQPINNVKLATFTNPTNPGEPSSNFSASINWGDGTTSTGTISGPDAGGVYTVFGSHTYAEEGTAEHGGPFTITVTISHLGISSVNVTDPTNITDAPLSAAGGFSFTGPTLTNATLATFTDTGGPEPLSHYSATINWGDSTTSAGTISGPSGSGVFTVTGSHTYSGTGAFTISVTINHETAPPVTVTDTVNNVPVVTITAQGGFTIFGVEGMPISNATVATFTSSNPTLKSGDFMATIKWGDAPFQPVNDITTGTIKGPDQNGVFTVTGSYTYIEESDDVGQNADTLSATPFYIITVTIKPVSASGAAATALSQARIFDAPLNATGGFNIAATAGQSTGSVVLATFIDTGGPIEIGTNVYIATVNWGDGTSPDQAKISGPSAGGVFTVTDSHTYATSGVFTITVTINHEFAAPVTVTDTASVANMAPPPGAAPSSKPVSPAPPADPSPGAGLLLGSRLSDQSSGQSSDGGSGVADPGVQATGLFAVPSSALLMRPSNQNADNYWQTWNELGSTTMMDLNQGAASDLALALNNMAPSYIGGWSAPS